MAKGCYVGVDGVARKVKRGYVGVSGVARRIKRAYIGVGGVARPCWSSDPVSYYGAITPLSAARNELAAASNGSYALFAGGTLSNLGMSSQVDAYNPSLTKSNATSLYDGYTSLAAASAGTYVIFAGGNYDGTNSSSVYNQVCAYNTSLQRFSSEAGDIDSLSERRDRLGAASVGNYALFAGGRGRSNADTYSVDAFDASLTLSNPTHLEHSGTTPLSVSFSGHHALFAGGYTYSSTPEGAHQYVSAYDTALTRSTPNNLGYRACIGSGAVAGNYALFAGGTGGSSGSNPKNDTYLSNVCAYTESLTRISVDPLCEARDSLSGTSIGGCAIFAGGSGVNSWSSRVDVYDASLTHSTEFYLGSSTSNLAATTIGNYAIFAGGGASSKKADAYAFVAS